MAYKKRIMDPETMKMLKRFHRLPMSKRLTISHYDYNIIKKLASIAQLSIEEFTHQMILAVKNRNKEHFE